MGCSFSGLNALYDAVNGGGDVWINENRFKVLRQLGEGGFAYVFLVKEVVTDSASASGGGGAGLAKKVKDPTHLSGLKFDPFLSLLYQVLIFGIFCDLGHFGVNLKWLFFVSMSSEVVLFWDFVNLGHPVLNLN